MGVLLVVVFAVDAVKQLLALRIIVVVVAAGDVEPIVLDARSVVV